MSDFKRENRYIVIKRSDLSTFDHVVLTGHIRNHNIPKRECVVIESDWPIYEPVWDMVQRMAEGREQRIAELEQERDALAAKVELAIEALDHRPTLQLRNFEKLLVHLREADTTTLAHRDLSKRAEGTKMAALFIELKAYAYDEEHGSTDPSTGTREYPGDGAEYYNTLMELAEELHKQAEGLQ